MLLYVIIAILLVICSLLFIKNFKKIKKNKIQKNKIKLILLNKKPPLILSNPESLFYTNTQPPTFTTKISVYPVKNSKIRINCHELNKSNHDLI